METAIEVSSGSTDSGHPEDAMLRAKAAAMNVPFVENLGELKPSETFVTNLPIAFARRHQMIGFEDGPDKPQRLTVAVADVACREQLQAILRIVGAPLFVVAASPAAISAAINHAYQHFGGQAQEFIANLEEDSIALQIQRLSGREDLLDNAARAPVIKLVNLMLFEAARTGASDVHIQPYEHELIVRLRIDGVLHDAHTLPKNVQEEVISRLKVMGRMNIAEKRLAQDGRATVQVGDRIIDLRIASLPASYGERVVIRLLDKSARLYELAELGMDAGALADFEKLITHEHGLILVTGPTGSGKTTTLYSALNRINAKEKNILTLEDPIEYQLDGISQTQVSDKKGMTFASGLRSVLRQDPDVIMVGEIRDLETATMAIQSSLTGHLVFSTLHTNDSASAITRLLDLGIEPYLLASSLVGVLAQRLVRKVCDACAIPQIPGEAELQWLGIGASEAMNMRRGTGCAACRNTGYRGRIGTFELLVLDDVQRMLIQSRANAAQVRNAAVRSGLRTLRGDGIRKILDGRTTIPEVQRVTAED